MRFILRIFQNILRWIYIIGLLALYITAIYRVDNKKHGFPILALALLMPFFMQIIGKILLKAKKMIPFLQKRAKRKSMDVITLFLAGGIFLTLFYLQRKMPVSLYGGWKDRVQILWNQMLAFSGMVKYLWIFWIFFAALAAIKVLKRNLDFSAALLLAITDAFLLFGMTSGYLKIGYYGFFLFSVMLVISYFRLVVKETYGETLCTDKKPGSSVKRPKRKHTKKKNNKKRNRKKTKNRKVKKKPKLQTEEYDTDDEDGEADEYDTDDDVTRKVIQKMEELYPNEDEM